MIDVFTPSAFKTHELTESINLMPYIPGRIQGMDLFNTRPVYQTAVDIEYKHGILSLIQTQPRGSRQGVQITTAKRKVRTFRVPHIPQYASVTPDDLPNIRPFGKEDGMTQVNEVVSELLAQMRQNLEATIEWHMIGALRGLVKDADGSTLYDLFTEFGIAQEEIEIDFSADNLKLKSAEIIRTFEDLLGGTAYSYLHVFCGDTFFDHIMTSEEVEGAFKRPNQGGFLRENQVRSVIDYGNILWENFRGKVGDTQFLAADEAIVVPHGVPGLYIRRNGPADTLEAVGKLGKPYVVTREFMPHGSGMEMKAQANPLIIPTRPGLLIKLTDTTPEES